MCHCVSSTFFGDCILYVNFKNKSEGVGYVRFGASNLGLYDFSEKTLFATVVFDVKDISKVAPVSTTVDLVVEVLRVSEVNPDTEMTDGSKEVILVDKEVVKKAPVAVVASNNLSTELTPSTYAEPTTAEPSDLFLKFTYTPLPSIVGQTDLAVFTSATERIEGS